MSDSNEITKKKKTGCLGVALIILLFAVSIAGSMYLFLPNIISSALNGGILSGLLPEEIRNGSEEFRKVVDDNISQLATVGLTPAEAMNIVSSLDYTTIEKIIFDIEKRPLKNTEDFISILSQHIDLSAVDLEKVKAQYEVDIDETAIRKLADRFRRNPRTMKTGFRVFKRTLLDTLESANRK